MVGRMPYTLALTLGLILVVGWLRPPSDTHGVSPDVFYIRKLAWKADHDIVLAGCSRICEGLAPAVMKKTLPGCRIANFGFNSVGYSEKYLTAASSLLDPESTRKTIVLGIAPHNFYRSNYGSNDYTGTSTIRPFNRWVLDRFGNESNFFRPYETWKIRCRLRGIRMRETYHDDGWMAARYVPEDPSECFRSYRDKYLYENVDPTVIRLVLDRVKRWTECGVRVFGVRVPTTKQMRELEDRESGFDQKVFGAQFEAAGGTWISVPIEGYDSYDGSHLCDDSARKLSVVVAKAILRECPPADHLRKADW